MDPRPGGCAVAQAAPRPGGAVPPGEGMFSGGVTGVIFQSCFLFHLHSAESVPATARPRQKIVAKQSFRNGSGVTGT